MTEPLLELHDITKSFGDNVANDRITLAIRPGRVHAIVGENGAGKSTLMSMISGTATPDSGQIVWEGRPVTIPSPHRAHQLGIGMVYQHFKLVGSLSVALNVFLGRELRTKTGTLDVEAMETHVRELSDKFGLEVDPTIPVSDLSVGQRQRVEVLKALSHDTRLLILDEPTAVLTPSEADDLFLVCRDLARAGCAVVFISHKLDEVLAIADEVTVIRDGRTIATQPATGLTKSDIARMMVGRDVLLRIKHTEPTPADDVLRVDQLTVLDSRGVVAVKGVSLHVRAGEIVGIAGVDGNGQSELVSTVAGMLRPSAGRVEIAGRDATRLTVAQRRKAGMAYIPEDRHHVGTGPGLSIAENIAATHQAPPVARAGWMNTRAMLAQAAQMIKKFDIRGAKPKTPIGSLSGGNMQKVVIAREFESVPQLLVVSQPTRGVDVGAMEFVHNSLVRARDQGAGILLVSADLNEVMGLSDRLLVMHRGEITAEFTHDTMSETAVGLAMAGVAPDSEAVATAEAQHNELATTESREQLMAVSGSDAAERRVAGEDSPLRHGAPGGASSEVPAESGVATPPHVGGNWLQFVFTKSVQPILAIVAALLLGAVVISVIGRNPLSAYAEMFLSAFQTSYGIGSLLAQSVPLLILSAAVIVSFRAGFFNIGGEGQLYLGAFFAAVVGFTVPASVPGPIQWLLMMCAGFIAAAVWGFIPGALLAYLKVDIIVTTLMMSTIATLLTSFFVTGPFKDTTAGMAASPRINSNARLPQFLPEYSLGLDFVLAIAFVVVLGLILTRSTWGLKVRQLGEMNRFAEYTGVNPKHMSVQVMALSGGVSGLAGALFVMGPNGGRFLQAFSPGYGFLAITVALLARLNPWAAILTSFFYANMMAGANSMQVNAQVPFPMVQVIQGFIILLITGSLIWNWRRRQGKTAEVGATANATATTYKGMAR